MTIETKLFFDNRNKETESYILKAIKNSDINSEFYLKMKEIIILPEEVIIANFDNFKKVGYEVMLCYIENKIIGHVAYQKHENNGKSNWQMFQCYIKPEYRKNGHAHVFVEKFLKYAEKNSINSVRLGAGKHLSMKSLLKKLKKDEFDVDLETHWINLNKRPKSLQNQLLL